MSSKNSSGPRGHLGLWATLFVLSWALPALLFVLPWWQFDWKPWVGFVCYWTGMGLVLCLLIGRLAAEPRGGGWRAYHDREMRQGCNNALFLVLVAFQELMWALFWPKMIGLTFSKRDSLIAQLNQEDARELAKRGG